MVGPPLLVYRAPPAVAESLCAEALRITERLGLDHFGARLQRDLATIALFRGNGPSALATYREFAAILDADNSCFYALAEGEHEELAVGIHVAEHLSVELVRGPHDPYYVGELHAVVAHLRRFAGDPDGCEFALNLAHRTLAGEGDSRTTADRARAPHSIAGSRPPWCGGTRNRDCLSARRVRRAHRHGDACAQELAAVALSLSRPQQAADLLATADEARRRYTKPLSPACRVEVDSLRSMVDTHVGTAIDTTEVIAVAHSFASTSTE